MKLLSFIEYKLHVEVDLFDRWIKFLFQPAKITNYFNSNKKNYNIGNGEELQTEQQHKKIKMF